MAGAENTGYSELHSPFETGSVVTGDKFIGRDENIKKCLRKLKGGGSVALRGIPRIGKTSLAFKLLEPEYWTDQNVIPFLINLGGCETFFHFCRSVMLEIEKKYVNAANDSAFSALVAAVKAAGDNYETISEAVKAVFSYLRSKDVHTVICIDEFDSVVRVFGESTETASICYYLFLRELMTNPQLYRLSLIITSRRSLVSLTAKADGGSVFHNAIETIPIHGFNNREMGAFREYAARHGLAFSEEDWTLFVQQAGRSPYMLSTTATALLDAEEGQSIKNTLNRYEANHYQYFDTLIDYLREDGNKDLRRMIQLFIGPKYNLSQNDINELIFSGYILQETVNGKPRYETLSLRFQQYLEEKTRQGLDLEIWPLVGETEKNLRDIIEQKMYAKYNDNWEAELITAARSKAAAKNHFIEMDKINYYISARKHQRQRLVDTLSFLEYMNIILEYRNDLFKDIFPGWAYKDIKNCFFTVYNARNPYAHFNECFLSDLEVQEADLACRKILEGIKP